MAKLTESELVEITRREVEKYAGVSFDSKAYPILDDTRKTYAVTAIYDQPRPDHSWIIVQARVEGEYVIIDEDNVFDKKLLFALQKSGVPEEQIILWYRGERLPETEEGTP